MYGRPRGGKPEGADRIREGDRELFDTHRGNERGQTRMTTRF
ncbi:MAG: hypothetical protein ACI8QZ_001661 [Chlamydiales bacterium]|jgi:hypothetical protein